LIKYIALVLFIIMEINLLFVKKYDTLDLNVGPNTLPSPDICGTRTVGQSFTVRRGGLARIDLMMGTHKKTLQGEMRFELWEDGPGGKKIADKTIQASLIKDNLFFSVMFKPLGSSKTKRLFFVLSAPAATPDNAACVWMNPENIYPSGELRVDGRPSRGDLVFRLYSKRTEIAEIGRIARSASGFLGHPLMFALILVAFTAGQIAVLWTLTEKVFPAPKEDRGATGD